MGKSVTLTDIAKACGTSNVTVSKALADKKGVSDELRNKIKQTAKQMGYEPSKASAAKGTRMIGVLIPKKFMDPNGSFYWALYNELADLFKQQDYFCIIETLSQEDEDELVMPKLITDASVSMLISLGQLNEEYLRLLNENVSEMLLLDYYIPGLEIDSITSNGYGGGYGITRYLITLGHKKIGFIGNIKATSSIFDRYMGYMKAMIENDLEVVDEWTLEDRDSSGFIDISFPKQLPTAFVCNCDETAYSVIRQLEQLGISVPNDISVVGYDNYLISDLSKPSITTIDVDCEKMAREAVKMALARIDDPSAPPTSITITGRLIVKESAKKYDK